MVSDRVAYRCLALLTTDLKRVVMPSDAEVDAGSQTPHQRLTDKVQSAFTMACSQRDLPVAELLYSCLEHLARHDGDGDPSDRQTALDALADAQAELAELRAE